MIPNETAAASKVNTSPRGRRESFEMMLGFSIVYSLSQKSQSPFFSCRSQFSQRSAPRLISHEEEEVPVCAHDAVHRERAGGVEGVDAIRTVGGFGSSGRGNVCIEITDDDNT